MQKFSLKPRRFHSSVLIGWGAGGVLCGVVLGQMYPTESTYLLVVAIILGSLAFVFKTHHGVILVILAGGVLGLWRGGLELMSVQKIQAFIGRSVEVHGTIMDDPIYGEKGEQQFRLTNLRLNGEEMPGKIWASSYTILDIKRSDHVIMSGKLRAGFGAFTAALSYAQVQAVERPAMNDPGREVRDWFAAGVRNAVPEPQASLGVGYVVGQRSALPPELDEQLLVAGLTHVVVASGYNLTVLVRLGRGLFSQHSKYLSFLTAAGLISGFVLVTGFSPSMSRAALVAGLSLAAWYYGRRIHPLLLLVFSAAVTVLVNPFFIWGDIGWYLSFAAFSGVLLFAPLVTNAIFKQKRPGVFPQLCIETLAAHLLTLPIILYMFGTLSLVSLPANLLIVPLVPVAMLLTFVAGIAGVCAPLIAGWFGVPANALLVYMTHVVEWVASQPYAQVEVVFNEIALVASYLGIVFVMVTIWRRTRYDFSSNNLVE